MKKKYSILLMLLFACFFSCSKNDKKPKKITVNSITAKAVVVEKEDTIIADTTAIKASNPKILTKSPKLIVVEKTVVTKNHVPSLSTEPAKVETAKIEQPDILSFTNIKKILSNCKTGQTLTRDELIRQYNIPEEAFKIVKSISKVAKDEIAIKWRSTWLVEKVSDAKFTDATMKVAFKDNKMYTSGNAIGIKYNRKIYTNLVIIGNAAYIPSVKGYHWQIGK